MPHHLPHASYRPRRPSRRLSLPFASLRLSTVDEAATVTDESSSSSSRERLPYFMDASQSSSEGQEVVQVVPPSTSTATSLLIENTSQQSSSSLLQSVIDKIGYINETRLVSSAEYQSGQEPKLFSNLVYKTVNSNDNDSRNSVLIASHSQPSIAASAALTCGTALGSGLLFLPHAIGTVGLNLPSLFATLAAYGYMTVSSLLTAELLINACGETGKVRNVGLLGLYHDYLGDWGGKAATIGFVGVSYVMMGIYFGLGGDIVGRISTLITEFVNGGDYAATTTTSTIAMNNPVITTTIFASAMAIFLATASKFGAVQRVMTNYLVPITLLAYIVTISMGLPTTPSTANNELFYPELVLNAFPLLFMSWSCHSVVPRVVYDLECDARKIKFAIWGGSTTALNTRLELHVAIVSGLAVVTSLIGTILGFVNEFYDAVGALPSSSSQSFGPKENSITKWQVAWLTLTPSVLFSILYAGYNTYNQQQLQQQQQQLESLLTTATIKQLSPNTIVDNTQIMEYTGAFGASTLFLIIPALMVWQNNVPVGQDIVG